MEIEDKIKWEEALIKVSAFAAKAHAEQTRKDGKTPYVVHPARVATRIANFPGWVLYFSGAILFLITLIFLGLVWHREEVNKE